MASKRVLLLYISEVSGHHRATLAIETALKIIDPGTQVLNLNAFNYTNPISEKIINQLYMSVIKTAPGIWDYLYDNPAVVRNIARIKDSVHKFNYVKLQKLFDKFKPDVVACSQAFPAGMVADFKKMYGAPFKVVGVLTDYIPHAYWIYDTIDYYITPADDISAKLVERGVPAAKIKPLGIPFDPVFNTQKNKRETRVKLGLDPDYPVILMMGGGHGIGPMKTIVKSLAKSRHPIQEIIVAGKNRSLYKSLKKKIKKRSRRVLLFEYVNNVHELMRASDMIITKPGGVTTAEVLAQGLPMIIMKPLPGQESHNSAYLTHKGAALRVDKPSRMHEVIDGLLDRPEKLQALRNAAGKLAKPNASEDIARLLLDSA
jgi:processive 1,2-diacylglycerol beta-glucosyltransferase